MATQIYKTTFQLKRGTAERWLELDPVLDPGEPGFELDTGKLKIGNGTNKYSELPYVGGGESDYKALTEEEIRVICI